MDSWFARLADRVLPAVRVAEEGGEFRWEFKDQTPQAVQIGKAVRMISGIRAALHLADDGFTVETASLLRMVSDFAQEILAIAEGLVEGRMTEPQERFIRQYFVPLARTPEEFEARERERYVAREDLLKAHYRMVAKTTGSDEEYRRNARFLDQGYDKYVHGAYATAMELYTGEGHRFMLSGHESAYRRCIAHTSIAGKLVEVVTALQVMAHTAGDGLLAAEVGAVRERLIASREQSGVPCYGLR